MTNMNTTPTPDQTPERPKTESLALIICDREGYPVGGHEERQPQGEYVRADECLKMEQEYERELTALRARLAEAEKVRDAAYREAEILRTNATYVKKVLDCANRYMPDLVKGAITVEGAIQERDALRATNATLLQRIAKLEEDRADLSKCVQWLIDNTSEEARRLFPGTIARLQKIASAVLTPGAAVGKEGE